MYREKLEQDNGSVDLADIPLLIAEYQQALAEKDREIAVVRAALIEAVEEREAAKKAYQQLMEKAILFAKATISDMITEGTVKKAQAFLKEREGM